MQYILQSDPAQQLGAHPVRHAIDDFRSVPRRIDMHAERAPAERRIDHFDNGLRHVGGIRIRRLQGRESPQRNLRDVASWAGRIFRGACLVRRCPAWAKWLVPRVKAPGTMIDVSCPSAPASPHS